MEKGKKDRQKSKDKDKEKKDAKKEKKTSKPKDKGKKEKQNDDSKVKRAKSAYLFFCGEKREEITKEHPDKKAKEILKLLGDAWSKLNDNEKKKYQEMADKDKERYEKECKEKGIEHKGKGKKKAPKSEKNKK